MAAGPAERLEGLLPLSPSPRSLLSIPGVVISDAQAPDHWRDGIEFEPESCSLQLDVDTATADFPYWWACEEGAGLGPTEAGAGPLSKVVGAQRTNVRAQPWTYWVGYRCSTLDVHSSDRQAEVEARLRRKLNACRSATIERELWEGQIATVAGFPNPFLADASTVTLIPGEFGYVTALGELEQRLADLGCVGRRFIHAQQRLVTAWASDGLVTWNPATTSLETAAGSVVVPGDGYLGTSPDGGVAASYAHSWAYATGPVRAIIGEPVGPKFEDISTVTPSVNDVIVRMEQDVVAFFDPCAHVGVEVNLCDRTCGGGS